MVDWSIERSLDWLIDWLSKTKTVITARVLTFPAGNYFSLYSGRWEEHFDIKVFKIGGRGVGIKLKITDRSFDWLIDWLNGSFIFRISLEIGRTWVTLECCSILFSLFFLLFSSGYTGNKRIGEIDIMRILCLVRRWLALFRLCRLLLLSLHCSSRKTLSSAGKS